MPRQQRIHHLRADGFFITDDPGKKRIFSLQTTQQILANLVFYSPVTQSSFGESALAKFAERSRKGIRGRHDPAVCLLAFAKAFRVVAL